MCHIFLESKNIMVHFFSETVNGLTQIRVFNQKINKTDILVLCIAVCWSLALLITVPCIVICGKCDNCGEIFLVACAMPIIAVVKVHEVFSRRCLM